MIDRRTDYATKEHIGVIAQEVEKIYPELVHKDDDGYRQVNVLALSALLLSAIKYLDKDIDMIYKYLKESPDRFTGELEGEI